MADLSKIKLNGVEYNLKDAAARESIPTKINDLTDKMFGIAWLDTGDLNRYIYCNNVYFSSSNSSDYSSPFLFMFKQNTQRSGTVTFSGSGNYKIYDINGNIDTGYRATNFWIYPNTETFKYGILYIGGLNDSVINLYPLARQSDVNSAIATAIGNINQFEVSIVADLPTTNIDTHTIYFVSNNGTNQNIYDEYMYINSSWEKIGTTDIDLSNYLQTTDIAAWAKQANKPTYIASEVGATTTSDVNSLISTALNGLATVATTGDYDDLIDAPEPENDEDVENMLETFELDYTSNSISVNQWQGGSY